jgi:translation initiation factor IF-2
MHATRRAPSHSLSNTVCRACSARRRIRDVGTIASRSLSFTASKFNSSSGIPKGAESSQDNDYGSFFRAISSQRPPLPRKAQQPSYRPVGTPNNVIKKTNGTETPRFRLVRDFNGTHDVEASTTNAQHGKPAYQQTSAQQRVAGTVRTERASFNARVNTDNQSLRGSWRSPLNRPEDGSVRKAKPAGSSEVAGSEDPFSRLERIASQASRPSATRRVKNLDASADVFRSKDSRPWTYSKPSRESGWLRRNNGRPPSSTPTPNGRQPDPFERPFAYRPAETSTARWPGSEPPRTISSELDSQRRSAGEIQTEKTETPKSTRQDRLSRLMARMNGEDLTKRGKRRSSRRETTRDPSISDEEHEYLEQQARMSRKQERERERKRRAREQTAAAASKAPQLFLPPHISQSNLATLLNVRFEAFSEKLEELGFLDLGHDHTLPEETAGLIATEYGFEPIYGSISDQLVAAPLPEDMSTVRSRPPVVTIMGHVDHGKTTILDYLRQTSVAATEHGGITQHIGAFGVTLPSGKMITFLDTPGHAAFLSMRQRGANVTDIVVLVVAADDSVMPQTIEAIKHAKAANVPIIVALNKIDKPDANAERVKQDLARHDINLEDFGGDTQSVAVSGKTGKGMPELEEAIITLSEILDHRAPPDGKVEGWLLEASTKPHGKVATVLVRRGTLESGDILVAGCSWTRVKTLRTGSGSLLSSAGPGIAVEVDGWKEAPIPGDEVLQADDERHAAAVIRTREINVDNVKLAQDMEVINEARKAQRELNALQSSQEDSDVPIEPEQKSGPREVCFLVKGDVVGSAEAVVNIISGIGNNEVAPKIVSSGAGAISESDIDLAYSSNATIISFNLEVEPKIHRLAESSGVSIIEHSIIYRVAEAVRSALSEFLPPKIIQRVNGEAEILDTFVIALGGGKKLHVAGCKVRNGAVTKGSKVRVMRAAEVVHDGKFEGSLHICYVR